MLSLSFFLCGQVDASCYLKSFFLKIFWLRETNLKILERDRDRERQRQREREREREREKKRERLKIINNNIDTHSHSGIPNYFK